VSAPESDAVLKRIADGAAHTIELDLERLPALLARLGQPHLRLPPVIHIAGTNGKGSTLAFMRVMFEQTGKRVQSFTSPHLLRVTEEIELSSGEIADDHLAALLKRVEDAAEGIAPTAYEALAAAAFLAFSEDGVADILLLETAMGGRMDVTNVVPKPALTVITPVAMDHMAFLGNTIRAIATEKAGILKPGVPCVANPQHPDAIAVVAERAAELGVPLKLLGRDFNVDPVPWAWRGIETCPLPALALQGAHQVENAALAIAAVEQVASEKLKAALPGLTNARWPVRMERIRADMPEVWVDGGHNPHAAAAIAAALSEMPERELVLILAMLDNRPIDQYLAALDGLAPMVIAVPLPGKPVYAVGEGMAPERIVAAARELGLDALSAGSVEEAMSRIPASGQTRVLIAGSLYLAGRAAEQLRS